MKDSLKRKSARIRKPRPNPFDSSYQPTKQDKKEKLDMPGMTDQQIRNAFFTPIQISNKKPD